MHCFILKCNHSLNQCVKRKLSETHLLLLKKKKHSSIEKLEDKKGILKILLDYKTLK